MKKYHAESPLHQLDSLSCEGGCYEVYKCEDVDAAFAEMELRNINLQYQRDGLCIQIMVMEQQHAEEMKDLHDGRDASIRREASDLLQVAFTAIKGGFNPPDWWMDRTRKELHRSYDANRAAREATQAHPAQKTLRDFGYAPGNYMSNCLACGNSMTDVDKRCRKCKPCAEAQLQAWIDAQDLPSPPAATGEK